MEGHTEEAVHTPAELEACLHRGARSRATHATDMNAHSSRSHAIFTITVSLKRRVQTGQDGAETEERLTAKMHLVDLAGSERLKKSGVQVGGCAQQDDLAGSVGTLLHVDRANPWGDAMLVWLRTAGLAVTTLEITVALVRVGG